MSINDVDYIDEPPLELLQHKQLTVLLPNYEEVTVDYYVSNEYRLTIKDLKYKISEVSGCGIDPSRIILIRNLEELDDRLSVLEIDTEGNMEQIQVVYKMTNIHPSSTLFPYDSFIKSMEPLDDEILVPIHSSFDIIFGPNEYGHIIRLSSLLDANHDTLQSQYSGDVLKELQINATDAYEMLKFVQWTNISINERLLLIDVTDMSLDSTLEKIRYDVNGINNGYYKGDIYSWQRYTNKKPIECNFHISHINKEIVEKTIKKTKSIERHDGDRIELEAVYDSAISDINQHDVNLNETILTDHYVMLKMQPYIPLQYSTNYAIVFCNNVPTVPMEMFDSPWMSFTVGGTCDDKVVLFRTESSP